jgi:rRNA maturation RNase YbeY
MERITFKALDAPNVFRDRQRLRHWLRLVARDHGIEINELAFVLMSDESLLAYNERYLGHHDFTDVITFDGQQGAGVSGDILISADRVRENAAGFGASFQAELRRVMVHGLLHLLGHQDKSAMQKQAMRLAEDRYLSKW